MAGADAFRVPEHIRADAGGRLECRWCHVGAARFVEPFFEDTLARAMRHPENARRSWEPVSAEDLEREPGSEAAVEPALFVLHVSRCGSTLLAQLFAEDDRCIVLSEVPALDDILRLPFGANGLGSDAIDRLFIAAVRVLARRRRPGERHLIVKFDSWHTLLFERIRRCFPRVPVVLLYRDPRAVVRSHRRQPGMHAVPGIIQPEVFGLTPADIAGAMPMAYLARVLGRYFDEYVRILERDALSHPLSYDAGVAAMLRSALSWSGIVVPDAVLAAMTARAERHGKRPPEQFTGDPEAADVDVPDDLLARYHALAAAAAAGRA